MSLFSDIIAGGIDPEQHDSVLLRRVHTLRLSTIAMVVFAAPGDGTRRVPLPSAFIT